MRGLRLIRSQTGNKLRVIPFDKHLQAQPVDDVGEPESVRTAWVYKCRPCGTDRLLQGLSIESKGEFESLATYFCCPCMTVLVKEEQEPLSIQFLIEGNVNISMNSFGGKRILLGVGGAGDILGLAAAVSGNPSEIRVETRFPSRIASMHRQDFLDFLVRHPAVCLNLTHELCRDYARTCVRLRTVGLASTTKAKLAWLLLEWCGSSEETKTGTYIKCMLTHEEIGECIGSSRETVTRTLTNFRNRDLVRQCGPFLVVPNRSALAAYGGTDSPQGPHGPAAA